MNRLGLVVLGNQLFPPALLRGSSNLPVFMAEDVGLCTYVRHHRQKIVMFLAAMRAYRDDLALRGFEVSYETLAGESEDPGYFGFEARLGRWVKSRRLTGLRLWEVEDKFFEQRLVAFAAAQGLSLEFMPSPMFVTTREQFRGWRAGHPRLHMADFYRWQRQRLQVLTEDGRPRGGQWSFDGENRQRLPRDVRVPLLRTASATAHVKEVIGLVQHRFSAHPGELDVARWWLPTTRAQALAGLRDFIERRLECFGPYEDALSERDPFLFHSVLTPALNLGLVTPAEVLQQVLRAAEAEKLPLPSVEGFVRQLIGWREFIRGVYQECSSQQEQSNFFGHQRKPGAQWYTGSTGLAPLDAAIRKAARWGWTHHIERLMVLGNLMTLCEIAPVEAHRWFMEMYVDSSDWVMGPNVYGMATFADGGLFATKPYLCGSNYLLKMSDYGRPRAGETDWCEIVDGLYWRFIAKHRPFFERQARMNQTVALLDRLDPARRERILGAAEAFIARVTT